MGVGSWIQTQFHQIPSAGTVRKPSSQPCVWVPFHQTWPLRHNSGRHRPVKARMSSRVLGGPEVVVGVWGGAFLQKWSTKNIIIGREKNITTDLVVKDPDVQSRNEQF